MKEISIWMVMGVLLTAVMSMPLYFLWKHTFTKLDERKERIENERQYDLWVNGEYMLMHSKTDCKKKFENLHWKESKRMDFDKEKNNCHITVDCL